MFACTLYTQIYLRYTKYTSCIVVSLKFAEIIFKRFFPQVAAGKTTCWTELDIQNKGIKNFSPHLWELRHLTALYLNNNKISRLPPEICQLQNLIHLDLSNNKLRRFVKTRDMLD